MTDTWTEPSDSSEVTLRTTLRVVHPGDTEALPDVAPEGVVTRHQGDNFAGVVTASSPWPRVRRSVVAGVTSAARRVALGWIVLHTRDMEKLEHGRATLASDLRAWERSLDRWQANISRSRQAYSHASGHRLLLIFGSRLRDQNRPRRPNPARDYRRSWYGRVTLLALAVLLARVFLGEQLAAAVMLLVPLAYLLAQTFRRKELADAKERARQRTLTAALALLRRDVFDDQVGTGGLRGASVITARIDECVWVIDVRVVPGVVLGGYGQLGDTLASHFRAKRGSINVEPLSIEGHYRITRTIKNPYAIRPYPMLPAQSVTKRIPLGCYMDGTQHMIDLSKHTLVAGVSGGGKSGVDNALIAGATRCTDVELWGIDMKDGLELAPWEKVFSRLAYTQSDAEHLLAATIAEIHRRNVHMRERGMRKWKSTREDPTIIVIIDEFAEVKGCKENLATFARTARAAGVWLYPTTQHPTDAVITTQIRNQMMTVIGVRVQRSEHSKVVFGDTEWDTSRFPEDVPGLFHCWTGPSSKPRAARAYFVDDDDVPTFVANAVNVVRHDDSWRTLQLEPAVMTLDDALLEVVDDDPSPIGEIVQHLAAEMGEAMPSPKTVQRALRALVAEGDVVAIGAGPGTRYRAAALDETFNGTHETGPSDE